MVFKNKKKGQAAIEFLMTYGWMLLVVLIVGALIFSFVDFGSLLPNKLDLSQGFRADASQILPSADTSSVKVLLNYVGTSAATVDTRDVRFSPSVGVNCDDSTTDGSVYIENLNTGNIGNSSNSGNEVINFINGQEAIITFNCPSSNNMIEGDVIEAQIEIPVENPKTKFVIKSKGNLRATIQE